MRIRELRYSNTNTYLIGVQGILDRIEIKNR